MKFVYVASVYTSMQCAYIHTHTNSCINPLSLFLLIQQEHTGRVFRLQFDDFQIVSSSHDDTILIWDFLDTDLPPSEMDVEQSQTSTSKLVVTST